MFIQLNKFIAESGICSRRKAIELIEHGLITVNGRVQKNPAYRVEEHDIVMYKSNVLEREKKIYLLLNKPRNVITTVSDDRHRKTVADIYSSYYDQRLYPVGRLDRGTTGLLVVTNDGELAQKLAHPRFNIPKVYHVVVDRPVPDKDVQRITKGVRLEDGYIKSDKIIVQDNPQHVIIHIHSGKNRVIRRLFDHLGYKVIKLDRIGYAGLSKQGLPIGHFRALSRKEIAHLHALTDKK
jgi:23S rRNA pseudouridine2605 synthase